MAEIGALSSYAIAMQQLQLNVIKQNIEMQQQVAEILLETARTVPSAANKGTNIDISI